MSRRKTDRPNHKLLSEKAELIIWGYVATAVASLGNTHLCQPYCLASKFAMVVFDWKRFPKLLTKLDRILIRWLND